MRILVIGASGLIGAHVTTVLRERGHQVTTVARTPRPGIDHAIDLEPLSTDQLRPLLTGHDGVVYAARTDEQSARPKPIHPAFRRAVVDPVTRLFTAATAEGLTRGVLMGSYYTYFHREHPQWNLPDRHVYIRCRVEQAAEARATGLPIAVLELPFVFGRAGDRLPNWAGPLDRWARSRTPLLAPAGGTAATSARTVAEFAADALDSADGGDIPIADENLTWADMLSRIAAATGNPRRVRTLPAAVVRAATGAGGALQALTRRESGMNPAHFGGLLLTDLFIRPLTGRPLQPAIEDTFRSAASPTA